MQADMVQGKDMRVLNMEVQTKEEREPLGLPWASETSKSTSRILFSNKATLPNTSK